MTDLKVVGELLTASEGDRVLKYKLLPFGEMSGLTASGHRFTANKGAVKIPSSIDHLVLNTFHKQTDPVGRFVTVEEKDDAIYASVHISEFDRGDEALQAVLAGEMKGISIEVRNPVIRNGVLLAGEMTGAALTPTPSLPSALLMASDIGDVEEALNSLTEALDTLRTALKDPSEAPVEEDTPEVPEVSETPEEISTESSEEEEELNKKGLTAMENSALPTALTASNGGSAEIVTFDQGTALIARAAASRDNTLLAALTEIGAIGEQNLFAALSPVTSANGKNAGQPVWLGRAWETKQYQRKFTTLVTNKALTGYDMTAWRFTQKPEIASYSGFPAQIPTNPVATEQYTISAERWAGGNDIDLKYRHFNDQEFLQAYYAAQAESYARVTDLRVLAALKASTNTVTRTAAPAGVSQAAVDIVDGALALADDAVATAAIIPTAMYRELLLTKENDSLKYLESSINLENGSLAGFNFIRSSEVNEVIVLTKEAVSFYELAGSPIRVEADNPANGGFTTALFGYTAVDLDARGVARVVTPTP